MPLRCARPERMTLSCRNASIGFITREYSNAAPAPFGVQSAIVMPFGT